MLKLSASAATDRDTKSTKGAMYAPLEVRSAEQAVAIKDAPIRLKLLILRFAAKYFCP